MAILSGSPFLVNWTRSLFSPACRWTSIQRRDAIEPLCHPHRWANKTKSLQSVGSCEINARASCSGKKTARAISDRDEFTGRAQSPGLLFFPELIRVTACSVLCGTLCRKVGRPFRLRLMTLLPAVVSSLRLAPKPRIRTQPALWVPREILRRVPPRFWAR